MAPAGRELFVYYRVRAGTAARAERVVLDFQGRLMRDHPGLEARWLRKDEPSTDTPTWMETYRIPVGRGAGIDASLQAAIEEAAAALGDCLAGERHVEAFR